ncbi:YecH family metal-binding protein [Shewanella zhuhaiensis]
MECTPVAANITDICAGAGKGHAADDKMPANCLFGVVQPAEKPMTQSVHGHEVMALMLAHGKPLTQEALITLIMDTFGGDARFHTCSAEGMTAAELVFFLKQKGKFIESSEGFATESSRICNH